MNNDQKIVQQVAAKAVIVDDQGRVLLVREASTGKNNTKVGFWGIVGGRLDPGESFENGLRREVQEETGLEVEIGAPLYVGEWQPVIHGVSHHIIAIFVRCTVVKGTLSLSSEHDGYIWIDPTERNKYRIKNYDCYAVDALVS